MTTTVAFSQIGLDPNKIPDRRDEGDDEAPPAVPSYDWDGPPPFHFPILLGLGPTWGREGVPGLPAYVVDGVIVCGACCRYARLSGSMYCINCDRSGRDREIGRPSELDLRRREETRKYTPPAHLAGGKGKPLAGRVKRRAG